ncbi:class I SAM-dependent methyltransferase [Azoarcus sp. DN11]|uniref:class I SAM-dependent methyltransferase n=1 Tax=Azoarcus sp. DN11 TaxID=356837 RepID=UPI000EAF116B|nr:class I SAM-dependent methyltransferase [Azoarcus sp. DN11]AYH44579.1 SAM-dependent methyltransferase [Azoarcus sp. DN11]
MPLVVPGGAVLDYACGGGRHARLFAAQGFRVVAVDRNAEALATLAGVPGIETRCADLEEGAWPFAGQRFDAVVVTNYLFRPRLGDLLACVAPGGVLIYETFMLGNERFGRPSSPEFLLRPGELLERIGAGFSVVAFEQGVVARPRAAVVQRVCAARRPADSVELRVQGEVATE